MLRAPTTASPRIHGREPAKSSGSRAPPRRVSPESAAVSSSTPARTWNETRSRMLDQVVAVALRDADASGPAAPAAAPATAERFAGNWPLARPPCVPRPERIFICA